LPVEKIENALVLLLLIEMMVGVGLSVSIRDVASVLKNLRLVARAAFANYVLVPAIAILLFYLFQAKPMVAAGFLLAAVCPGAPFAPPLTALAKGYVHASVGLMVILAASSAVLAPLLLSLLLPLVARGADLRMDTARIVTTLSMTQLAPLGIGLFVRESRPQIADKLKKPASLLTGMLSLAVFAMVIALQYRTLAEIRLKGFVGICLLIVLCLAAGWFLGGLSVDLRKAVGLTTGTRNAGVALVIATASFPDTAAVGAVVVFAIFQTILLVLLALLMRRLAPAAPRASDAVVAKC